MENTNIFQIFYEKMPTIFYIKRDPKLDPKNKKIKFRNFTLENKERFLSNIKWNLTYQFQ